GRGSGLPRRRRRFPLDIHTVCMLDTNCRYVYSEGDAHGAGRPRPDQGHRIPGRPRRAECVSRSGAHARVPGQLPLRGPPRHARGGDPPRCRAHIDALSPRARDRGGRGPRRRDHVARRHVRDGRRVVRGRGRPGPARQHGRADGRLRRAGARRGADRRRDGAPARPAAVLLRRRRRGRPRAPGGPRPRHLQAGRHQMTHTDSLDLDTALGPPKDVRLPGGTVRYRERGAGPTLLFVHGLLVNGALWRKVVPELARDFRCIAPDWPLGSHTVPLGEGADRTPGGMAKLIADFMAELDLEDVTLVGNDSGGALSQLVVTRHPERVGRLVLTPCDAFDNFPPRMFRYLGWVAKMPGGIPMMVQTMRLRANRRTPIAFGWLTKRRLPDAVSDHYVAPAIRDRRIREDARGFILGVDSADTL